METARLATDDDLPDLAVLWREAMADTLPRRGGAALLGELEEGDDAEAGLRTALGAPERVVVAGCIDRSVVGLGVAALHRPRSGPARAVGSIELLYVEPGARDVGVGEAIMDVVTDWCAAAGCSGIDAPALPGSRHAKAFFETAGFVTRLLVMYRPIDSGAHQDR